MSLNLETKTTYHYFDEFGMLVVKGDERSWRDSIGRTVVAWIAYGKPKELVRPLDRCVVAGKKSWILKRHPAHKEHSSRDHWSYMIIFWKIGLTSYQFKRGIPMIPRMRGLNSWMKALTGNKRAEWWYYTLAIPGARTGNGFLRFCRWAGRIEPERDNNWWIDKEVIDTLTVGEYIGMPLMFPVYGEHSNGLNLQHSRTTRQKLWAWIIFTSMPAYALHNKAWQIYVMRKSPKRDTLRKILLKRVAKRNILVRLVLGDDTVTQEEVDNFPHMTNFPSGVYLDETCRRDIRELTDEEAEFNTYEKDLINWLFNKQKS